MQTKHPDIQNEVNIIENVFSLIFAYVYVCVPEFMSTTYVQVPFETRRGRQIPRNELPDIINHLV